MPRNPLCIKVLPWLGTVLFLLCFLGLTIIVPDGGPASGSGRLVPDPRVKDPLPRSGIEPFPLHVERLALERLPPTTSSLPS